MRPTLNPLAARTSIARSVLLAWALAPCVGFAATDDVNAPAANASATASVDVSTQVRALGRRVLDGVLASEREVVDALANSVPVPPAPTAWRVAITGDGSGTLESTSAARAARAAALGGPIDPRLGGRLPGDLGMGARWHVLQGDADTAVPCASWMAAVHPVTGESLFGGNTLRPSMHLSAEWALGNDLMLGVMPGVAVAVDRTGHRYADGTLAITLGRQWQPGVNTFVDVARDRIGVGNAPGGATATTVDAGLTLATSATTTLDFAVARGLTPAAPTFEAGVGVSSAF